VTREDQIKKAINSLDRKCINLEKKMFESAPIGGQSPIVGL
jgi:hypothetical protein